MAFSRSFSRSFSSKTRSENLKKFREQEFDLVIIGGGITGAGAARDAASRGMSVALVEMQDFAQGTSSRSSKLVHGGIRYLENLEFGLVFEALSERRLLFEIAPHLVHPLRFVLPLFKGGRVGMFKMSLGMWLYDALSMFEAPEMHERLNKDGTMTRLPLLKSKDLLGSYVYSDAYMDDDRLTIETLRSANALGAVCANYVKATGAVFEGTQVRALICTDQLSGEQVTIRGKHFITSVGPWTDKVASSIFTDWKKILRPSKGVHLTFDRKRLNLPQAVVMAEGKRIVFGIPRHEMIIIGTTDTDFKEDPSEVRATADDVRYLLKVAGEYFPGAKLTAEDIIATYAGVRPLVDDGSVTESKTSREHLIYRDQRNVTFVAGGKYTTYRLMAEQTIEAALEAYPIEQQLKFAHNHTEQPLNPKATVEKLEQNLRMAKQYGSAFGIGGDAATKLVERHGEEAWDILKNGAAYLRNGDDHQKMWAVEAAHAIESTMCMSLTDFYTRRSPLFLSYRDHGVSLLPAIGAVFQAELGWDDIRKHEEFKKVQAHIDSELAWRKDLGL